MAVRPPAARRSLLCLAVFLVVCCCCCGCASEDEYRYGRATNYWDNNQGSCHFKDVYSMKWYAAYPDTMDGFAGSCGKCFEVQCVKDDFKDGYGDWMSRSQACKDEGKRVVVKITDSCPCVHANAYSNKRWCCGDMAHLDLGVEAFRELADEHWGVIGIKWKETSCDKLGPQ